MLLHISDDYEWDIAISDVAVKEKLVQIIAKKYHVMPKTVHDMLLDLMKKNLLSYEKLCTHFESDIRKAYAMFIKQEKQGWKDFEKKVGQENAVDKTREVSSGTR